MTEWINEEINQTVNQSITESMKQANQSSRCCISDGVSDLKIGVLAVCLVVKVKRCNSDLDPLVLWGVDGPATVEVRRIRKREVGR